MKLLVVSHTPHYKQEGLLVGWGPTVRELDQLARLFDEVIHLAVIYNEPAPPSSIGYQAKNIRFMPVCPAGGDTLLAKAGILAAYPGYWRKLEKAFSGLDEMDCVHVRCPANLPLLALLWLAIHQRPKYRWVKYAGNWQPKVAEPFFFRLQRNLVKHNIHRGTVTVNGRWVGQQAHIYSFYNPGLHLEEIRKASARVQAKSMTPPMQLLFVGALNDAKGAGRVLQIADHLYSEGLSLRLHMIGDGPDRPRYEAWVKHHHLDKVIEFHGWLTKDALAPYYAQAHLNILPSMSEGWPKVLSEGMAYGVVPVASAVSSIPQIQTELQTGRSLDPQDLKGFVQAIMEYHAQPELWKKESQAGIESASRFSYELYLTQVKGMFQDHWGIVL